MIRIKKNIKIIFTISVTLLLMSCGFKKINQKNADLIYIQNIKVSGVERISYTLKNDILLISSNDSKNKYDVEVEIKKKKTTKIKDQTGRTTRYNLSISANLKLISVNNKKNTQRIFVGSNDFEVAETNSETIKNEKNAAKSVMQQLTEDILNFIVLSMRKQ